MYLIERHVPIDNADEFGNSFMLVELGSYTYGEVEKQGRKQVQWGIILFLQEKVI